MGKRLRLREAQRRRRDAVLSAKLEAHSHRSARPRAAAAFADFNLEFRRKVEALRSHALRAPEDWACRIKSRSEERRFIDLVRFVFARYRVPAHLERVWIEGIEDDFIDKITAPDRFSIERAVRPNLRHWYLTAAQGGSLHKHATHLYLSRHETHHFLAAPDEVTSVKRALWYAVARAQSNSREVAIKVARSKVANYSIASSWWKEVARFFARHPTTVSEMDDLVDFLLATKHENETFTLKGRTLATLRRRLEAWHHDLRKSRAIGGGTWEGAPLPDVEYEAGQDHKRAIWRFRQIKTGNDLFREGQRMHHCVVTYKWACLAGRISIWSLTNEFPIGRVNRGVTMEVTSDGRIVQCRGFANRLPYGNEVAMAKRWAREHGLTWASLER